jgi:hypothetical protein
VGDGNKLQDLAFTIILHITSHNHFRASFAVTNTGNRRHRAFNHFDGYGYFEPVASGRSHLLRGRSFGKINTLWFAIRIAGVPGSGKIETRLRGQYSMAQRLE